MFMQVRCLCLCIAKINHYEFTNLERSISISIHDTRSGFRLVKVEARWR